MSLTKESWEEYKMWREVSATYNKHRPMIDAKGRYDAARQARETARNEVQRARRDFRAGMLQNDGIFRYHWVTVREKVAGQIRTLVQTRVEHSFRSMKVYVHVGKKVKADKKDGERVLFVDYGWIKNVYDVIYKHIMPPTKITDENGWFILKAERVRINIKNIALYEVKTFHLGTGENRDQYLSETLIGKKVFRLGRTAKLAAEKAQQVILQEIGEKLGENDGK